MEIGLLAKPVIYWLQVRVVILSHNIRVEGGSDRMNRIIDVAQYVFEEYKKVTGEVIDEMKLQFL